MKASYVKDTNNLIGLLPVGILILDNKGHCTYANSALEKLAGVEAGQALGRGWMRHIQVKQEEDIKGLPGGTVVDIDFTQFEKTTKVRMIPSKIDDDLYLYTALKIDEEVYNGDLEIMQKMLDCTDAILYSVNRKGKITAFNHAASEAIKLRKGVAMRIGDYWPDIVSGDSGLEKERMEMLLDQVLCGHSVKTIEELLIPSGEKITYSVQAGPIFNEERNIIGAVLCAHNITLETRLQKEAAEKALIRNRELEQWNRFYDMLLSVLAHDLRHPFSSVIMGADLVAYNKKKFSTVDIKRVMVNLRNTSKKSIELLEGLLYWVKSKKEDFSYKPIPMNLHQLIYEANALFIEDQEKKRISLLMEVPEDQIVYAHRQLILFIFRNLINNATKYSFSDSTIRISSRVSDGKLRIAIQDNGKGMNNEQVAKLFRVREEETSADGIRGAGMALTIIHDMIGQMNGHILVESELGKGTTFYLVLPSDF